MLKSFMSAAAVAVVSCMVGCSNQAAEVRKNNSKSSCDESCMQGRDQCVSECASRAENGQNPDNASCSLACDDAKKTCMNHCKDND
jgi:hypothetical protein